MTFVRPAQRRRSRDRREPKRCAVLIPEQGGRCHIGSVDVYLRMTPDSLRDHNRKLQQILKKVSCEVGNTGSIQLDPSFSGKIIKELRVIGRSAYTSLSSDFVRAFDSQEETAGALGLALTITSNTFPLLWEMVYTGSSRGEVQFERFWGFRHSIARFLLGSRAPDEEEIDADRDFLFCYHHSLSHWQQEHDEVKRLVSRYFRFHLLEEVLPEPSHTATESALSERFVDVLRLPELGLLHLACHCVPDPDPPGVLLSKLMFSCQSLQICIRLAELKDAEEEFEFSLRPLVFLNACKTMTNPEHLLQGDSFPAEFLIFGASGVIATACDIPDPFAAAFAAKFYENLCQNIGGRSPTVSEALLRTRQFFIKPPYYNPLGLAYGLYAHNDLHIVWEPYVGNGERANAVEAIPAQE